MQASTSLNEPFTSSRFIVRLSNIVHGANAWWQQFIDNTPPERRRQRSRFQMDWKFYLSGMSTF
jgi:hypothetical protein